MGLELLVLCCFWCFLMIFGGFLGWNMQINLLLIPSLNFMDPFLFDHPGAPAFKIRPHFELLKTNITFSELLKIFLPCRALPLSFVVAQSSTLEDGVSQKCQPMGHNYWIREASGVKSAELVITFDSGSWKAMADHRVYPYMARSTLYLLKGSYHGAGGPWKADRGSKAENIRHTTLR